ncbi:MAG: aldo/keto reductase [Spirochaetales bacterium]|nr:aldo/keto reductase [Spirochaetales bacterium]
MLYRILGSTPLEVRVVGVGTWQFGGEWGQQFSVAEVDAILGAAREEGINLIDTAECYGDHLSESLIGARLAHERDEWIVASKFGHRYHGFQDRTRHWHAQDMREQLEASLRALRTDYIDVLQFHSPTDEEFVNEALWEQLRRVKEEGKVRFVGLSVSKNDNLMQVERAPEAHCETLQIIYNRIDREPEAEVFPAAERLNLGVLARVPLASGFLSGKYDAETRFPADDWRSNMDREKRARILEVVEEIRAHELPAGVDMVTWALAWPLRHRAVTTVIPGVRSVEQVRANAAAVELLEE